MAACEQQEQLEQIIPNEVRKGGCCCFEVQIVETDDPRWTAANIHYNKVVIEVDNIAIQMLGVTPTTMAGVEAIVKYTTQYTAGGDLRPDGTQIEGDDGISNGARNWHFYLLQNLGSAPEKIAA
jgi:hypothetical protein